MNLREALSGEPANNIALQPLDRILMHQLAQKSDPLNVIVRGEVARPGRYPLAANMHVSDLVRSAGGLLRGSDPANGDLSHYAGADVEGALSAAVRTVKVNVAAALEGDAADNPVLLDGDVLTVPQHKSWSDIGATVTIRGEVARAGTYGIQPGERVSSVLRRAGGIVHGVSAGFGA